MFNLSILIPTYNGEKTISACLQSVIEQNPHEVIIVDSGSRDNTLAIVEHSFKRKDGLKYSILHAPSPDNSSSADRAVLKNVAFNLGLKKASGDFIGIINQDIILNRDWWKTLLRHALSDHSITILGGKILHCGNDIGWTYNNYVKTGYSNLIAVSGNAYCFRRDCALKAGGFKTEIWRGVKENPIEDAVLSMDLLKMGKQFIDADAVAMHNHPIKNLKELTSKVLILGKMQAKVAVVNKAFPLRALSESTLILSFLPYWFYSYKILSYDYHRYANYFRPKTRVFILSFYRTLWSFINTLSKVHGMVSHTRNSMDPKRKLKYNGECK